MSFSLSSLLSLPPSLRTRILHAADIPIHIIENHLNDTNDKDNNDDDMNRNTNTIINNPNSISSLFASLSIDHTLFNNESYHLRYLNYNSIALLKQYRFLIIDSFLQSSNEDIVKSIEVDVENMLQNNELQLGKMRNANSIISSMEASANISTSWSDKIHRGDLIKWLHLDDMLPSSIQSVLDETVALQSELNRIFPSLNSASRQCQLAVYPGNATHYSRHRDTFKDGPARRVTCIYYANSNWKKEDGGELRIHFNAADGKSISSSTAYETVWWCEDFTYVDVAPIANRLIIFESAAIDHEVLPSYDNRIAITTWLG